MFSFTRFCLRVLADLNEIIRRMERNVILTIAIINTIPKQGSIAGGPFGYCGNEFQNMLFVSTFVHSH